MDQCDLLLPYPPCLTGHLNLNGFGIGKALFTFDTFLLIVSGVFLGQVLSGVREGLTQQAPNSVRPALLSTKISVSASVLFCCVELYINLKLNQLILYFLLTFLFPSHKTNFKVYNSHGYTTILLSNSRTFHHPQKEAL